LEELCIHEINALTSSFAAKEIGTRSVKRRTWRRWW